MGEIARLLEEYVPRVRRRLLTMAVVATIAAAVEGVILVIVVRGALHLTDPASDRVRFEPLGIDWSIEAALWIALGLVAVLVAAHLVVARALALLTSEALYRSRRHALEAFVSAPWPAQAADREGALQETVSTLALNSSALSLYLASCVTSLVSLGALLAVALVVDPLATAVIVVLGGAMYALLRPISRRTRTTAAGLVEANSAFAEHVARTAGMAMEVASFGVGSRALDDLDRTNLGAAGAMRRTRLVTQFGSSVYRDLAMVFLVVSIALLVRTGSGDISAIGAVVLLVLRGLGYATRFQTSYQQLNELAPNLTTLRERTQAKREATIELGDAELGSVESIRFADVAYRYPDADEPAIRDVSLVIRTGSLTGLAGESGSGKSTLLQLLLRLRLPTAGAIEINGVDHRRFSPDSWSRRYAFVPQSPRLIEGSIAENVRFFRDGFTDADVLAAIEAAGMGADVGRLPDGIDSRLGPRGQGLSGGQQQRLAIARALLASPQVLVLDEPTSALDEQSTESVLATITTLRDGHAVVVASHEAATLAICDQVLTVGGGTVARAPNGPAARELT